MDRFWCSRRLINITYRTCFWQFFNNPPKNKFEITHTYKLTKPRTETEFRLLTVVPIIMFMPVDVTHYNEHLSYILYRDTPEDVQKYIDEFKKERKCWDCENMKKSCKEK